MELRETVIEKIRVVPEEMLKQIDEFLEGCRLKQLEQFERYFDETLADREAGKPYDREEWLSNAIAYRKAGGNFISADECVKQITDRFENIYGAGFLDEDDI